MEPRQRLRYGHDPNFNLEVMTGRGSNEDTRTNGVNRPDSLLVNPPLTRSLAPRRGAAGVSRGREGEADRITL